MKGAWRDRFDLAIYDAFYPKMWLMDGLAIRECRRHASRFCGHATLVPSLLRQTVSSLWP